MGIQFDIFQKFVSGVCVGMCGGHGLRGRMGWGGEDICFLLNKSGSG